MHPFNVTEQTKRLRIFIIYMAFSGSHDFYLIHNCNLPELNNMEYGKSILEKVKIMYDTAKENKIL